MYTRRTVTPLTINTRSETDAKPGVFTTAAFRYTEEPVDSNSRRLSSLNRPGSRQAAYERSSPGRQRPTQPTASTTNYQTTPISPPAMFVRALYNYEADDRTSLSFRQGDIIQVITQLESGWWDGIINDVRGWFPSNYCQVVPSSHEGGSGQAGPGGDEASGGSGTVDEYDGDDQNGLSTAARGRGEPRQNNGDLDQDNEAAAFWVPQVTSDGGLYYYNTLTGVSRMELPLETPISANDGGPRDRMNVRAPDQTRPPPEMMAGGYQRDEDDASASELDGDSMTQSQDSLSRRRRSYISDGVSPATSSDSLSSSPIARSREDSREYYRSGQAPNTLTTVTSFTGNLLGQYMNTKVPRSFFDDGNSSPVTWNRLVENMRKSVESYRQAINNADRSEYVRKAEDISDHLRMLLAAGSGTTDNHSGNPSVISTNKALYPHFRDMMSKFSKLVLSSHIAASDWPAADSYSKCLQEAEGVLQGVYGFVEVARAQRGEDIQRLVPGFVLGRHAGGNWQNNNLGTRDPVLSSFADQDEIDPYNEPSVKLDKQLLDRMDDLKRMIVSSIRRLEEHLVVTEKIVNPIRHEQISNSICTAAGKVIEYLRPYLSTLESVNLAQVGPVIHGIDLGDFGTQKQRLYDLVASLVVACQTVAGPLSDEWADLRGEPLCDRVQGVQNITKQLEGSMSQIGFSLQTLFRESPSDAVSKQIREAHRRTEGNLVYDSPHVRSISKGGFQRPQLNDVGQSASFTNGIEPTTTDSYRDNPKLKKFFGEVPTSIPNGRESEEIPSFLKLEHEGEIAYDQKVDPPQLRGGTLIALVEQLTRHDRLDSPFNNTFLLTYRSFTTASELFEMLVKRFSIQPPSRISQDDYRTWVDKKQKPIRFRVVNILKSWFDTYWMEGNDDTSNELLRRVYSFAKDSVATSSTPGSGPLMTIVEQRLRGLEANSKRLVLNVSTQAPAPIIPKNMKKLKFLDIDVTEFARQLTIIESKLYGKIKPTECLNKTWQKKFNSEKEPDPAPNVKALILHSNQLTNWVAEMILTQSDVKKRVVVIKHFVSVADVSRRKAVQVRS